MYCIYLTYLCRQIMFKIITRFTKLVNARNNLVRHQLTIFLIILAILQTALFSISLRSINQQHIQEDGIKHHQHSVVYWICQEAPRVGSSQFKEVLEVSSHTPESRGKKKRCFQGRLARFAINNSVLGFDILWLFSPYKALPFTSSEYISFTIWKMRVQRFMKMKRDDSNSSQCMRLAKAIK